MGVWFEKRSVSIHRAAFPAMLSMGYRYFSVSDQEMSILLISKDFQELVSDA